MVSLGWWRGQGAPCCEGDGVLSPPAGGLSRGVIPSVASPALPRSEGGRAQLKAAGAEVVSVPGRSSALGAAWCKAKI